MNIKIKEIAEIANVSQATVSLALNNKPGISKATRRRILEIAQALRNERNKTQFLSQQTKGSIRFLKIVKHGQVLNRDHEMFISRYIDGLELETRQNGYNLEITTFKNTDVGKTLQYVQDAPIDGLVVLGTELSACDLQFFEQMPIPVGFIDTRFDFTKFDFVDMDNIQAVFHIIQHLIEHNHQAIGHIKSPVETRNFELRSVGFRKALEHFGLPFDPAYIFSVNSTFEGAYHDMRQFLKKGVKLPTALFSTNDLMAYACIKALKEEGVRVPEDISVVGFDDLPMSAMMDPPLTTMKVSQRQIGQMAIRLLLGRIDGSLNAPTIKINIGGQLISRQSVKML